jgi:hypothetical protein
MSNKTVTERTAPVTGSDSKTPWESPALRHVGHLADVLLTANKSGLSEDDPGISSYKPHGLDPH